MYMVYGQRWKSRWTFTVLCDCGYFFRQIIWFWYGFFQEHLLGKRHENQKMAAFNLGVSEAVKVKKTERPIDFHVSLY